MRRSHGTLIFLLGLVALAILLTVVVFLDGAQQAAEVEETPVSLLSLETDDGTPAYDPLVTVVPYGEGVTTPTVLPTDPQYGAEGAAVTIIEFGDFECPACNEIHTSLAKIVNENPEDVQVVWKDFPLAGEHPYAETAAIAARCAAEQDKFWEYHDQLFANQAEFLFGPWVKLAQNIELNIEDFATCLESRKTRRYVVEGYFIARALELVNTPTLFINEQKVTGSKTYEELNAIVQEELDKAFNVKKDTDDSTATEETATDTNEEEDSDESDEPIQNEEAESAQ